MLKSIFVMFVMLSLSLPLAANEIFKKETEQFDARINYKDAKLNIKVTPKGEWHINDGFPASVKPSATCLTFEKKKYKKKDAKVLKDSELSFEIPATCKEGEKAFKAKVVLGVCTDAICKRVQLDVDAKLNPATPKEQKEVIKK